MQNIKKKQIDIQIAAWILSVQQGSQAISPLAVCTHY